MFQMAAFVCGLTAYPGMDENGCYFFLHASLIPGKEVCEETLENTGLGSLAQFLISKGEADAKLISYECVAAGDMT